jgi:2-dehydro-3-deoxyphosphogluconate aldolase / (4S)-4-hydroxy-2-oxoglutarate aldolase
MNRNEVLGKIVGGGLVPIFVDDRLNEEALAREVLRAGIEAVEVSCRHPRALGLIARLKKACPDLAVGAASLIEDGRYLDWLRASGKGVPSIAEAADVADFLVSLLPFRRENCERYRRSHVIISGVTTPGEAHQALDWGANLAKFSGLQALGGPAYLRGMDAATHRGFPFFVTGGVRPETIGPYVEAQVLVFGAGFEVILGEDLAAVARRFASGPVQRALARYTTALAEARARYQTGVPFGGKDAAAIAAASGRCLNHDG